MVTYMKTVFDYASLLPDHLRAYHEGLAASRGVRRTSDDLWGSAVNTAGSVFSDSDLTLDELVRQVPIEKLLAAASSSDQKPVDDRGKFFSRRGGRAGAAVNK